MQISLVDLMQDAEKFNYAVGAFNVYNLEGIKAVIAAAEAEKSPVILQLHPSAFKFGGPALIAACKSAAAASSVPVLVHLDHASSAIDIESALGDGVASVMADGSMYSFQENMNFTRMMASLAHERGAYIESELGRLSGSEDGLSVPEYEAKLTDPRLASYFVTETKVDILAVCIGNVHGHYHGEPRLDFDRLEAIRAKVKIPLVLHGASGLPDELVKRAIACGVRKFNVNTEVREAYLSALGESLQTGKTPDLIDVLNRAISAMQAVVTSKLRLFGSSNRARLKS